MTARQILWSAIAAAHLGLAAFGVAKTNPFPVHSRASHAYEVYGAFSETNASYGFFAPGVMSARRGRAIVTDASGRTFAVPFGTGEGREVEVRILPLLLYFSDPELRGPLAGSWAARLFGRYPDATRLELAVDLYEVPTMGEVREGKRPEWKPAYDAVFVREPAAPIAALARSAQ